MEIERLIATLEAKIDKYEKNLAKAYGTTDKQFKKIEQRGKQMETRLANLGGTVFKDFARGAIAAILPIVTFSAAINKAKEGLKEFGDIADNAKAAGLDAEFFQSIAYQAQQGGVEISALAGALATFAKNSGLAVEGRGKMATALRALDEGLLENIRNAATQEERVKLVADALARQTDAAKKAAIATAAFGDSGLKLADVFKGGADEIERMQVRAKELGLIVDRDLIASADELGDEFDTTTKIVDLQLKQALVNLGPVLVWLAGLAGGIAEQIGGAVDNLKPLAEQRRSTIEGSLSGIGLRQNDVNPAMTAGLSKEQADAERAPLLAELKRRAMEDLRRQLTGMQAPSTDKLPTLDELDELDKGVKRLNSDYQAWADDGVQDLIDKHKELAETMAGEVVGGIRDIWNAFKSGDNVLDALLNKVMSIGESMLFGGLQSLLTPKFGGGWNIPTGPVSGGFYPAFPGRATGGTVAQNTPYMVGERGPELFVPANAGRIMPNSASKGDAGSVTNFYIDAKGAEIGVETKIVRAIQTMVPGMIRSGAPLAVASSQMNNRRG